MQSRSNISRAQRTESIIGKNLPASIEAERSVLGSILLNDALLPQVAEHITAQDFYHPPHQLVWQAITTLSQELKRIDLVSVQDQLIKAQQLEAIGGPAYLAMLQEDITSLGLAVQHAQIIKEKAMLRQLIGSAADIISNCYNQNSDDISMVLDEAERTIFNVANARSKKDFVQLNIWLKKTFAHLSDIKSHAKGITGVPTGFAQLDQMTSGMQPGDLIILAARPSMGKTSLALNILLAAAAAGRAVGMFSLEMSAEQLTLRLLSTESGIAHHNIRNATISSDDWITLTHVAARLAQLPIFIDDTAGLSIMDLRARARKLTAEYKCQFIVIDYLQLLHSTKRHENRHQEVSEISRSLKALAKELNMPILALSQLSRAVDSRMDKRPMLSDLRESGAIEQDADVIAFLYRDCVYNQETENPNSAELIIGKQRNGPTGVVHMNFVKELTKFEDL